MVIKEKLSLYSDYKPSMLECLACKKFTHPFEKCPLLHYIPDTKFLINRSLFSCSQKREFFPRKKKKKLNALFYNSMIQSKILLLDSSIFSDSDDNDEKESVYTLEKSFKPVEMASQENIEKIKEESDEESKEKDEEIPKFPENTNMFNMNLDEETNLKPVNESKFVKFVSKRTVSSDVLETCTKEGDNNNNFFMKKNVTTSLEKIPSLKKISRRNGVFDNNEGKESIKFMEMFFFDFESGKNYETYFPEGNVKNVLEKINDKIISSPNSRHSRKSSKQKMKKRIKCSKFFLQSNNHVASKELSNSS